MPPTKQRSSSFGAVSKSAIEQASSALQKLPEKPKESWSLREAVSLLHDSIATALSRGYSHEEVTSILAGKGVSITPSSLKRYLAVVKREKEGATKMKTRRPRKPRQTSTEPVEADLAPASTNGAAIAQAAPEAAEPAATSKRRTRTTTTSRRAKPTKADDQSDATKTAAKTKSKPTSRAKTPSRSTSTRTRRKSNS